ncbi:MAG: hypothetical protein R3182_10410, partial [Draconibacterium sp.]|nr:hypothetical protein [Draconibacterium sp.]
MKTHQSKLFVFIIALVCVLYSNVNANYTFTSQSDRITGTWLLVSATMDGKPIDKTAETLVLKTDAWISQAGCTASGKLTVKGNSMTMTVLRHSCPGTSIPSLTQKYSVSEDGDQLTLVAVYMGATFRNVYRRTSGEELDWVENDENEEFENIADEPDDIELIEDDPERELEDDLREDIENADPEPLGETEDTQSSEEQLEDDLREDIENADPEPLGEPEDTQSSEEQLEEDLREDIENADPEPLGEPDETGNSEEQLQDDLREDIENADPEPLGEPDETESSGEQLEEDLR